MKPFYALFLILLFASCTPENMLNRKLDGEWSLISVNGVKIDENYSKKIKEDIRQHNLKNKCHTF